MADAAATKSLAMVGYFIPLVEVKLNKLNLVLTDEVKRAVPYSWDPTSLARYTMFYFFFFITFFWPLKEENATYFVYFIFLVRIGILFLQQKMVF